MRLILFSLIAVVLAACGTQKPEWTTLQGKAQGTTFTILLIGTVLLIGALNFLPALALGPIVEHFAMLAGQTF